MGSADARRNPFLAGLETGRLSALTRLFGGAWPTLEAPHLTAGAASAFPLDACLEHEGLPRSGTGQVALLTGANAARMHGGHFGPWTPVRLRPFVEAESVLARARAAGRTAAFANAYPRWWPGPGGSRRVAAPPLAARGAGVLNRHEDALAAGRAVSSEIVNDVWKERLGFRELPDVTPSEAGTNLAAISAAAHLTLYAHYATDTAGHQRSLAAGLEALERVDAFLGGVLEALAPGMLLLVASDHGNLEDAGAGHTRNPALGLAWGPGHEEAAARLRDIRDVTPFVLEMLEAA